MERLTYEKMPSQFNHGKYPTKYTSRHTFQEVAARLAAYEDTGLEPEEVMQTKLAIMGKSLAEIKEFEGVSINRMIELAQAEKDGRLVVLPCKPGAPVWEIGDFDGGNLKKRPFSVEDMSFWRFGTTVFLTREEAEAALKKREEAENETD